ncbi:DUF6192 family protein, partial [Streptomyces sp. NPDC053086]|uniref:DUF6192 family protein n=1 Tax=unclassified Streptomyces TaxID=2593676 RepID=UPI0037CD3681
MDAVEVADDKVGNVSASRYAQIVAELRKLVETATGIQFAIGDAALEVEPMGGPAEELFTVRDSLHRLAEDIGVSYRTVEGARWAASKWPAEHRLKGVSFTIHRTLAGISDPQERFAAVLTPPEGK